MGWAGKTRFDGAWQPTLWLTFVAIVSCTVLACSQSFDGRIYRQGDVAFQLRDVPHQWRRIDINDTALAFRDDERETTAAVNARCGKDAPDVPLTALTQHLFLQFTDRQEIASERRMLDGREGLETQMVAKLDGVAKNFLVLVLKKNGCVYDFLYIANDPISAEDRKLFERLVGGFSTLDD